MRDALLRLLLATALYALVLYAMARAARWLDDRRAARTARTNGANADVQAARAECRLILAEMRAAQARLDALVAVNATPTAIPPRIARQLRNDPGLS